MELPDTEEPQAVRFPEAKPPAADKAGGTPATEPAAPKSTFPWAWC